MNTIPSLMHKLLFPYENNMTSHSAMFPAKLDVTLYTLLSFLVFFAMTTGIGNAGGILVWKEKPFHTDKSAKALLFDEMKVFPTITWFYYGGTQKLQRGFEKHEFYRYIPFPNCPPPEVTEQEQADSIKYNVEKLRDFVQKFPNAEEVLKPHFAATADTLHQFETGNVYFIGKWMPRAEYERIQNDRSQFITTEEERLTRKIALRRQKEKDDKIRNLIELTNQAAKTRSIRILVAYSIYFALLLLTFRRKKLTPLIILLLIGILGTSWLTYGVGEFSWATGLFENLSH